MRRTGHRLRRPLPLPLAGGCLVAGLAAALGLAGDASAQATPETGRIAGQVIDEQTGSPLGSAQVFLPGSGIGRLTDVEGRYTLRDVPAGAHELTVRLIGYARKVVTGVEVRPGAVTRLDIALPPEAVAVEAITVSVAAERGTTAALLYERQRDAAVTDAIGAAQISRSPDSDAASAVRRVPGSSVVNGKFVYVRGLGERYGSTSLNGSPLPSPEVDKKAVPLDLVPADFLESISIAKSYLPDQPADYSGGLVQIRTRTPHSDRLLKFSSSVGYHSLSSLQTGLGYAGGGLDFLGFDDGTRDLPSLVPADRPVSRGSLSPDELERIGEAFAGSWGPRQKKHPVDQSHKLVYGQDFDTGGRPLSVFLTGNYSNGYVFNDDLVERVFASAGAADPEVDNLGVRSVRTVRLGGMLKLDRSFGSSSRLTLSTLYNRNVDDEARILEGFNLDSNTDQQNTRLRYVASSLFQSQLEGRHVFGKMEAEWRIAYSRAGRFEPNTREVLFRRGPDGEFIFDTFIQSGSVFHQDLEEDGYAAGADLTFPFRFRGLPASIKLGGALEIRDRKTFTRRFRFLPRANLGDSVRALPPDGLFGPENIAPDSFEIQEATFRPDNYDADQDIYAGYLMLDAEVLPRLRFAGGVRLERSEQFVQPLDLFPGPIEPLQPAVLNNTDLVPGVNLTYAATDQMNVRLAVSRTVGRPQFRELAPFQFADFAGGFLQVGNPALEDARITNLDARWEWFPGPGRVLSVSGFYKEFDDPIEQLVFPSTEFIRTWVNADEARNVGAEFEARTDLGFLSPGLRHLTLNTNLTVVDSEVTAGELATIFLPSSGTTTIPVVATERRLQGQSPFVVNAGLGFLVPGLELEGSLFFNRFGRRIESVGTQTLPPVFEEARNSFDFVLEQPVNHRIAIKATGTNLTGAAVTFTQDVESTPTRDLLRRYDLGRSVSLSLAWTPLGVR